MILAPKGKRFSWKEFCLCLSRGSASLFPASLVGQPGGRLQITASEGMIV